jgi:hypothetical protein
MEPSESRRIAMEAARRLVSLIDADGRFLYRYDAATRTPIEGYHTTRHAAAIWGAAIAARKLPAPDLVAPLQRAMGWLVERHVRPFGEERLPAVAEDERVDAGGVALGLLAALELHRAGHDPRLLELACGFGRYLVRQRRPDGDFIHRRIFPTGEAPDHVSPYATGQVLLALGELYAETGDSAFLAPALESESILAAEDYGVRDQSHWMLYGIEALEKVAPRAAHRAHACRIAGSIIVYPLYRTHGKSNPIACYSEALGAYLRLLRRRPAEPGAADSPSEALVRPAFEENLQMLMDYRTSDGAFMEGGGVPEVQIDHIQHPLAAFLGHALLYSGNPDELARDSRPLTGREAPGRMMANAGRGDS